MTKNNFKLIMESWRGYAQKINEEKKVFSRQDKISAFKKWDRYDGVEDSEFPGGWAENGGPVLRSMLSAQELAKWDALQTKFEYSDEPLEDRYFEAILDPDSAAPAPDGEGADAPAAPSAEELAKQVSDMPTPRMDASIKARAAAATDDEAEDEAEEEAEDEDEEAAAPGLSAEGEVISKVKNGTWRPGGKAFPEASAEVVDMIHQLQKLVGAKADGVFGNETAKAVRASYYGKKA